MHVDVSSSASKQIRKLTKEVRLKVSAEIKTLENVSNISDVKSEKLTGTKDRYKIRVRDFRIIYQKYSSTYIEITSVRDRKDIYNKLFGVTLSL